MPIAYNFIPSLDLRAELEHLATIVSKPEGTTLFRRGDEVAGVFLIRKGRIRLALENESSVYPDLILCPGVVTGLPATMSGDCYSLTAKVIENAELAFVSRDSLLECLKNNPPLCFEVMGMLSDEISDLRAAFKRIASKRQKIVNPRLTTTACGKLKAYEQKRRGPSCSSRIRERIEKGKRM